VPWAITTRRHRARPTRGPTAGHQLRRQPERVVDLAGLRPHRDDRRHPRVRPHLRFRERLRLRHVEVSANGAQLGGRATFTVPYSWQTETITVPQLDGVPQRGSGSAHVHWGVPRRLARRRHPAARRAAARRAAAQRRFESATRRVVGRCLRKGLGVRSSGPRRFRFRPASGMWWPGWWACPLRARFDAASGIRGTRTLPRPSPPRRSPRSSLTEAHHRARSGSGSGTGRTSGPLPTASAPMPSGSGIGWAHALPAPRSRHLQWSREGITTTCRLTSTLRGGSRGAPLSGPPGAVPGLPGVRSALHGGHQFRFPSSSCARRGARP